MEEGGGPEIPLWNTILAVISLCMILPMSVWASRQFGKGDVFNSKFKTLANACSGIEVIFSAYLVSVGEATPELIQQVLAMFAYVGVISTWIIRFRCGVFESKPKLHSVVLRDSAGFTTIITSTILVIVSLINGPLPDETHMTVIVIYATIAGFGMTFGLFWDLQSLARVLPSADSSSRRSSIKKLRATGRASTDGPVAKQSVPDEAEPLAISTPAP